MPDRWGDDSDDDDGVEKKKKQKQHTEEEEEERHHPARETTTTTNNGAADASPRAQEQGQAKEHKEIEQKQEEEEAKNGVAEKAKPTQEPPLTTTTTKRRRKRTPLIDGCRPVEEFERLDRIEEGSYGVVYRARDRRTGEIVALKRVKLSRELCAEGFPVTALRETNVLLALQHEHVVSIKEMVVGREQDKVFMVMDYYDHDIKSVIDKQSGPFSQSDCKAFLRQLLSAVSYLHARWFVHRDIKTSNLLYSNASGRLALADFGLARHYGDPQVEPLTLNVVTLWYRSPELLLGSKNYAGPPVDCWSVGCVFAELLLKKPLFGHVKGEIEQLNAIFKLLGVPNDESWPGFSDLPFAKRCTFKVHKSSRSRLLNSTPTAKLRATFPAVGFGRDDVTPLSDAGLDLLARLLTPDPAQRLSAADALDHPFFTELPLATPRDRMPHFELDRL